MKFSAASTAKDCGETIFLHPIFINLGSNSYAKQKKTDRSSAIIGRV